MAEIVGARPWSGLRRLTSSIPASQVLARFAAAARDEVDLDALTAAMLRAVNETLQPDRTSLWLGIKSK